jgi:AraC-like DNA-binding protein
MRYLTKLRLQQAATALAASRLTIQQIARRVGYHDEAAFSKAFRREYGLAPGAYRRRTRLGPLIELA